MMHLPRRVSPPALTRCAILLTLTASPSAMAAQGDAAVFRVPVTLGDYRFSPTRVRIPAGRPVTLELRNTDKLIAHNFTLEQPHAAAQLSVDVGAGQTRSLPLPPLAEGRYRFFCNQKLPFMKSHRERGMHGELLVAPGAE